MDARRFCDRANAKLGSNRIRNWPERYLSAKFGSHRLDLSFKHVFSSAESFLEAPEKLILFALGKRQVVISQLTVFLFKFPLNFVPTPFQL